MAKTLLVLSDKKFVKVFTCQCINGNRCCASLLINVGLRTDANIIVETALARDPHQFAVILGFGATAIYPYLGL